MGCRRRLGGLGAIATSAKSAVLLPLTLLGTLQSLNVHHHQQQQHANQQGSSRGGGGMGVDAFITPSVLVPRGSPFCFSSICNSGMEQSNVCKTAMIAQPQQWHRVRGNSHGHGMTRQGPTTLNVLSLKEWIEQDDGVERVDEEGYPFGYDPLEVYEVLKEEMKRRGKAVPFEATDEAGLAQPPDREIAIADSEKQEMAELLREQMIQGTSRGTISGGGSLVAIDGDSSGGGGIMRDANAMTPVVEESKEHFDIFGERLPPMPPYEFQVPGEFGDPLLCTDPRWSVLIMVLTFLGLPVDVTNTKGMDDPGPALIMGEAYYTDPAEVMAFLPEMFLLSDLVDSEEYIQTDIDRLFTTFEALVLNKDKTKDTPLLRAFNNALRQIDYRVSKSRGDLIEEDEFTMGDFYLTVYTYHIMHALPRFKDWRLPVTIENKHLKPYMDFVHSMDVTKDSLPPAEDIIKRYAKLRGEKV